MTVILRRSYSEFRRHARRGAARTDTVTLRPYLPFSFTSS